MPGSPLDELRREIFVPDVVTTRDRSDLPGGGTLLRRRTPTDAEILASIGAAAVARPVPVPTPAPRPVPSGPSNVLQFPTQPGMAVTERALKELLKRGAIVIGAALTLKDILRMIEDEQSLEEARQTDARVEGIRRRIRARRQISEVRTIPEIGTPQIFEVSAVPNPLEIERPSPVPLPETPLEIPGSPAPLPGSPTLPGIPAPSPPATQPSKRPGAPAKLPKLPAPGPSIKGIPIPGVQPGVNPATIPGFGVPAPAVPPVSTPAFPVFQPIGQPSIFSVGEPATNPTNLTEFGTPVQESPFQGLTTGVSELISPQPNPEADPERCRAVKRRRRRKGRCKEGFYAEYPGRTEFIEWREVDCLTRIATDDGIGGAAEFTAEVIEQIGR